MDDEYVVSSLFMEMMILASQFLILQQLQKDTKERQGREIQPCQRYQPPISYNWLEHFTFAGLSNVLCYHLTRFYPPETQRILPLLGLEQIRFCNCLEATPEEAFGLVLMRLSYPTRYWMLMDRFGHSQTWLLIIFNDTILYLYRRYRKGFAWDSKCLIFPKLMEYVAAIEKLGGGRCFWGFVDRTLDATCRPMVDQRQFYSGHKQKHGYKHQAIVTPDGLVSSLMGPFLGRRNDWSIVGLSGLESKLRKVNGNWRPAHALYLYGDPVYCTVYGIMGPYKNYADRPRTEAHEQFNKAMSRVQIEVKHSFAIHQNLWTWNGFHLGLKLSQGAAVTYAVSILLANIWTCVRGNQTSTRFMCMPPSLEDYLQSLIDNNEEDEHNNNEGNAVS